MQMPACKAKRKPCRSNRIVAGWMLAALLLMLGAPISLLNDAAQLALLPMGALALIALFGKTFCLHRLFLGEGRGRRLTALALTAAYFLLLSVPNLLSCPLFSESGLSAVWWRYRWERLLYLCWNWTGFLIGYVLSVYACMHYGLSLALNAGAQAADEPALKPRLRVIGLYPAVLPVLLICLCLVFASSPSLFIGDAPSVWYGARDNLWSEWHTAGYMLFVKLCSLIWNTQRMVTLVQTVACVYILNYALTRMVNAGCGRGACRAYLAAVVCCFVPLYFLQVIIKDVVFALSVFAFTLGVLNVVRTERPRVCDWVWLAFFGLCTCLFRHAGALPVILSFAGLLIFFAARRSKAVRGLLAAGACVAVCNLLIVNVLAYRVMHFERNPEYIAYSTPMAMIGAVAASGEPIDPADAAVMERVMPVEKWAACYNKYFADSISRPYGAIGEDVEQVAKQQLGGELLKLNWRFFTRHTKTYVTAFFDLNSLMWELATPADGYVRSYLGYPATKIADFVAAQGYAGDGVEYVSKELKQAEDTVFTGFAPIVNRYAELLYGLPVTRCLFWRGGFANLALIFCAAVLLFKRRARDLLALVPIAAVTLGMLFSMPAQEVRYVFPNLLCATFLYAYACGVKPQTEEAA